MNKYYWDNKQIKDEFKRIKFDIENNGYENFENSQFANISELFDASRLFGMPRARKRFFNKDDIRYCIKDYSTSFQREKLLQNYSLIKSDNKYDYTMKFKNNKISTDNMLKYVSDLFISIGGDKKDIDKIYNPNNHFLFFRKYINTAYFLNYKKDGYITLKNNNDILSLLRLAHETGHYYEFCLNNKSFNNNDKLTNYDEIVSIFFEHLMIDILFDKKIINEKEKDLLLFDLFALNFDMDNFYKAFSSSFYVDSEMFNKVPLYINQFDLYINYGYSYLIALELYYLYKENKEDAINKLNKILLNNNEHKEEDLLKECKIDLDGKILLKHLKKIKKNI